MNFTLFEIAFYNRRSWSFELLGLDCRGYGGALLYLAWGGGYFDFDVLWLRAGLRRLRGKW